ncbi:unnamed protein product (macronuclear) [Paramecium tetraurelia]|uniref:Uncharacterized protein n=1 Tax=Paramecium tetraurelia TaxID=5888 RepID=A0CQ62_PARTE|nr:uncharacterized protein GSPATT00009277001 [Paramecium tetraurelia]CAK72929.1 unnamed protein product [Paramecium tetraurelia]|eukprot:XP_001440326.1 hypothetical protein (macronuclear) [Paramecium tetraurelia strain d4-2]
MGATVCKQRQDNYGQEVIQDQNDVQINNITFAKEQSSKLDRSSLKHPSLKKKTITQILGKLPDDPINLSNNQSRTYYSCTSNLVKQCFQTQRCRQLEWRNTTFPEYLVDYERGCTISKDELNIETSLLSTRRSALILEFKEQTSQYSKSCKVDKRQKLLNMILVEDNFDDYIYYDWKNSNLQLISVNDQNLLKKLSSAKPMSKQVKKNA